MAANTASERDNRIIRQRMPTICYTAPNASMTLYLLQQYVEGVSLAPEP